MTWQAPLDDWDGSMVPMPPHPAAFAVLRKHHIHEGVDLYCAPLSCVYAVEPGRVVQVTDFTGAVLGHTWWNDTQAVWVQGASGLVVYGEVTAEVHPGDMVEAGQRLARVKRVLKKDKGRPMDMLHLELRDPLNEEAWHLFDWNPALSKPAWLLDPTPFLMSMQRRTQGPSNPTTEAA